MEECSDQDLKELVERLSREVKDRKDELCAKKIEIQKLQSEISRKQQERSELTNKLSEVSPLVDQCLQIRETLKEKQRLIETITQGTFQDCCEIKELEKRLQELEARPHLEKLEVENKENIASIEELTASLDIRRKEYQDLQKELQYLQDRRVKQQRRTKSKAVNLDDQLDSFIRKVCKDTGLQLP